MKIQTPSDSSFLLPREVLSKLAGASATELKVLIYLFAAKEAEVGTMSTQLGIAPPEVEAAIAFWRGAGIFVPDERAEKKPVPQSTSLYKSYDSQTIAQTLEGKADFKACCELVGNTLQKQLTKNDYSSLLYLYDYVGLQAELISGIAAYCVANGKTSMQYLMKTALHMYEEDGIDCYAAFEAYMTRVEARRSKEGFVRRLCGMGERAFSAKEAAFVAQWFDEWALSEELVQLAYDKTVDALGKVNLSYMNAMLKRWYESGFAVPEDVLQKDQKPKGESDLAGYGDSDAFFEAALKAGLSDFAKGEAK